MAWPYFLQMFDLHHSFTLLVWTEKAEAWRSLPGFIFVIFSHTICCSSGTLQGPPVTPRSRSISLGKRSQILLSWWVPMCDCHCCVLLVISANHLSIASMFYNMRHSKPFYTTMRNSQDNGSSLSQVLQTNWWVRYSTESALNPGSPPSYVQLSVE